MKSTQWMLIAFLTVITTGPFGTEGRAGWESEGLITFENRGFVPDSKSTTRDWGTGLYSKLSLKGEAGPFSIVLGGFGRIDRVDPGRNIVAFEDDYLGLKGMGWEMKAGWQILNWGALEFFNPSDVVNARNFDSDIESKDKFGELMLTISRSLWEGGELSIHWMPRFESPKLPGVRSRLNFIDPGLGGFSNPIFIERTGAVARDNWNAEQAAARFTQTIEDVDFSLYGIYHMDRHQALVTSDADGAFHPTYFPVLQMGGTYTHILGKWILKAEFAYRRFNDPPNPSGGLTSFPVPHGVNRDDHSIAALGLEYGIGHDGGWESIFIVEGISIFGTNTAERKSLQLFQRDVLLAYHLAINDVDAKELTLGLIFDGETINSHEIIINAQYAQRLGDVWKIKGGVRIIEAPQQTVVATTGLQALDRVAYAYLNLTRSF